MRIATWNINGLNARLDYLRHWLDARRPDVVGLQELKMVDDRVPHEALAEAGYRVLTHGQKSWNGVAVLSRGPMEPVQVGLPGQEDLGARLLTAEGDDLVFTTVYCPNGKHLGHVDYGRKLEWFEALGEHVAQRHDPNKPYVLAGDFNTVPEALDSWNEERFAGDIFHTEAERQRLSALLDWGLVDLFRHLHPNRQEFSWWDYRGGAFYRKQGLRIDFLLATAQVAERTTAAVIDRDFRKKVDGLTASDHAPVYADLG
ncbi:MAG: exodeoxyribonuclease III [Acidobacteriota bacterium]